MATTGTITAAGFFSRSGANEPLLAKQFTVTLENGYALEYVTQVGPTKQPGSAAPNTSPQSLVVNNTAHAGNGPRVIARRPVP